MGQYAAALLLTNEEYVKECYRSWAFLSDEERSQMAARYAGAAQMYGVWWSGIVTIPDQISFCRRLVREARQGATLWQPPSEKALNMAREILRGIELD
jgi:hypothetical protein